MVFMSRSTRPVSTINRATVGPIAKRHPNGVSLMGRADSGPRFVYGWAKAQPAVVLILKHLRKRGHGFKSHSTRLGEARNQTGGPLVYKAYATGDVIFLCMAVFFGYNQYWPDGFMFFVVLCWACNPFCFRELTSVRKLFFVHYGRYWYSVSFRI